MTMEQNAPIQLLEYQQDGRPPLCSNCERFDIQSFNRDPYKKRGYSVRATEQAAQLGCPFCSLLVTTFRTALPLDKDWSRFVRKTDWLHMEMLEAHNWWTAEDRDDEGGNRPVSEGLRIGSLRVTIAPFNYGFPDPTAIRPRAKVIASFHVVADLDDAAYTSGDVRGTYVDENVQSQAYLLEIQQRLDKCFSHQKCCQTLSGSRQFDPRQVALPTRCIDVLQPGLHIAETGSITASYLILSHRWAPETEACATTTDNIELRRRGDIDGLASLPKTFRDTFDIARGLGIRYVWIDSLCIIQRGDDGVDWTQEAPKMADYYQQAVLTICATSSSRERGLFPERTLVKVIPKFARLPFRNREGLRQGFFYVYPYESNRFNGQVDEETIQRSELFTRGWVFQEWILSRRLVYFTPAGVMFECATEGLSNDRGDVWPSAKTRNGFFIAPNRPAYMQGEPRQSWYYLVEAYSAKFLTKQEKDVVVALAGVAKAFGDLLRVRAAEGMRPVRTVFCGLEYISGLWVYDLHCGLLWQRKAFDGSHRRLDGYPSWSWTSVGGPVLWDSPHIELRQPSSFRHARWTRDVEYEPFEFPVIYPEANVLSVSTPAGDTLPLSGASLPPLDQFLQTPSDAFSALNKTAYLHISGKVGRCIVREKVSDKVDLEILGSLCGKPRDTKSAQTFWRKVCIPTNPTEIVGWSTIEHPEYQEDVVYEGGVEALALFVATSLHERGYGLGFWGFSGFGLHTVHHVLFIRELHGNRFERMGIGRLFGKDVAQMHRETPIRDLELV